MPVQQITELFVLLGAALQASGFCTRVLTKPVIATITVATPARDLEVRTAKGAILEQSPINYHIQEGEH